MASSVKHDYTGTFDLSNTHKVVIELPAELVEDIERMSNSLAVDTNGMYVVLLHKGLETIKNQQSASIDS